MRLIKCDNEYIIQGYSEICNYEIQAEVLYCFLSENSILLFGCKLRELDMNNIDNEEIDPRLKKMYKELAPYMVLDDEYYKRNADIDSFIDERTVFVNNEWPFPWRAPNKEVLKTTWFHPNNKEDIIKTMQIDEFINCVVLDKNCQVTDYSYAIGVFEAEDYTGMSIIDKKGDRFMNEVVPKLRKLINNLNIEVD